MPTLSVNIDHVATVRQARKTIEPDILQAGMAVQKAGAHGITVHMRHDRRHIQGEDVVLLRKKLNIKINLEMAATQEMFNVAVKVRPHLVTLVPENPRELTTQGGLDILKCKNKLVAFIKKLKKKNIRVSIFVNPDKNQIKAAKDAGADVVEIHTGIYADYFLEGKNTLRESGRIKEAVKTAGNLGLGVNAGHGLTYKNVKKIANIKGIDEMSIGHSIISRSIFTGLEKATREMKNLIK